MARQWGHWDMSRHSLRHQVVGQRLGNRRAHAWRPSAGSILLQTISSPQTDITRCTPSASPCLMLCRHRAPCYGLLFEFCFAWRFSGHHQPPCFKMCRQKP